MARPKKIVSETIVPETPVVSNPPEVKKIPGDSLFLVIRKTQIKGVYGLMALAYLSGLLSMLIWASSLDIQNTVFASNQIVVRNDKSAASMVNPKAKGELLVRFVAGLSNEDQADLLKGSQGKELDEIKPLRIKRILVPVAAQEQVKNALLNNKNVEMVEDNYLAQVVAIPNDPSYPSQWQLPKIGAPAAWDINQGATGSAVAVLDTGIDPAHPDLKNKLLPGYNFYDNNNDTRDVYGHGTKVAGVAAAMGNNAVGVAGVNWNGAIMPLRISDTAGWGTYSAMAQAIIYAVDHGVRIINLSFGGTSYSSTLQSAVDYAWSKNAVVFASAGNANSSVMQYPAACNHVIAVAATDSADNRSSFSSFGSWVDVSAPGSSVYSTVNGGGYGAVSGTSFASPITAGLATLMLSVNPGLTATQIESIIEQSADDLGAVGFDQYFGYGRINATKALQIAKDTPVNAIDLTAPTITVVKPTASSTLSGTTVLEAAATDNVGLSKVDFYANGLLLGTDNTEPFSLSADTLKIANGTYSFEYRAYDAAGNIGYAYVMATVYNAPDTLAPVVTISQPIASSTVTAKNVNIAATATDARGVTGLTLSLDGSIIKTCAGASSCQQKITATKIASGNHQVTAVATDAAGNKGTASSIFFKK